MSILTALDVAYFCSNMRPTRSLPTINFRSKDEFVIRKAPHLAKMITILVNMGKGSGKVVYKTGLMFVEQFIDLMAVYSIY